MKRETAMLEREAKRKYQIELAAAMVLYVLVLLASIYLGKRMEPGVLRTLVLVSPAVPMFLSVWVIARQFGRMDEFIRMRSLESLSIAAAITAGLALTYGFLESAGFPHLSMFWVWGVMGLAWGAHAGLRCVFAR
jgi:hypothetical protein